MKNYVLALMAILCGVRANAQDTFSIVAADSTTREVGSAGASCVDLYAAGLPDATFLSNLLPNLGAINTQASYVAGNQNNARTRMLAGDTPAQIVTWLSTHDVAFNPNIRQYGIVGFSGNNVSAAGYTGSNCLNYHNHITGNVNGIYYSIQGNILLGQQVLDSMEYRFVHADGDLACRLMAALQGAKMIGADTRCAANGSSSLFAFVQVAQPSDTYGNPSFRVSVKTHDGDHLEPVDTLQTVFNAQHTCSVSSVQGLDSAQEITVYPNPSGGDLVLQVPAQSRFAKGAVVQIYNNQGLLLLEAKLSAGKNPIHLGEVNKGFCYYRISDNNGHEVSGTLLLE